MRPDNITQEELEKRLKEKSLNELKRAELGLSKRQFKRLLKQEKFEATKHEYRQIQKEKRKLKNASRDHEARPHKAPKLDITDQQETGVNFIVDCGFNDLMNDKEINSLSNQITRIYSSKRHCKYNLPLIITSFGGKLQERFEKSIPEYRLWKGIEFDAKDIPLDKEFVYLTADTDEIIEKLNEGTTYIIGGIVDKNRHKNLCVDKAKKLGLKVGKLPIDKYIEINGRQVLATSHVYEICCKWFETKDWKESFNAILPPRKLKSTKDMNTTTQKENIDSNVIENTS